MYQKLLVGTDGSENSERALKKAKEISNIWNGKMIVFHSTTHKMPEPIIPMSTPYPSIMDHATGLEFIQETQTNTINYQIPKEDYENIKSAHENQGIKIIDRAKQVLKFEEENIEYRLITEKPSDYILERIDEEGVDLVVLGCKGQHSKLKQVFVGTVATKVLNNASCDVLIVR